MGSMSDKVKGTMNEAVGKTKQAAGKMLDDPKLKAEGSVQERKGEAQKAVGKTKDAIKNAVDDA